MLTRPQHDRKPALTKTQRAEITMDQLMQHQDTRTPAEYHRRYVPKRRQLTATTLGAVTMDKAACGHWCYGRVYHGRWGQGWGHGRVGTVCLDITRPTIQYTGPRSNKHSLRRKKGQVPDLLLLQPCGQEGQAQVKVSSLSMSIARAQPHGSLLSLLLTFVPLDCSVLIAKALRSVPRSAL